MPAMVPGEREEEVVVEPGELAEFDNEGEEELVGLGEEEMAVVLKGLEKASSS